MNPGEGDSAFWGKLFKLALQGMSGNLKCTCCGRPGFPSKMEHYM